MPAELTVILPTRNEALTLENVIDGIRTCPIESQIIVADHLSTDGTREIALRKGALLYDEIRQGVGIAVRSALKYVETPYVALMDADGTYPAGELLWALFEVKHLGVDAVMGCRQERDRGSMALHHIFGNYCLSLLASILYGSYVKDVCTGFWVMKTDVMKSLPLRSNRFTLVTDLYVSLKKGKYKVLQEPIRYLPRVDGSKAKLRMGDGFKIAWFLIHRRFS